ncbi:large-conductance mechanosensitive channel protein MscL [Hufsiella ginkgonis]|uniref:Large-conductance mechanosensitive channel n=1 Tax=Hufsiella ginkgonis TaxID=2695274 RepID=A0A7K1XZG6_9SPHI|nr:large-conductance mechanosensitive channel protein MscL [Hufsiella ginkgonis]MXV15936.1 large-conductance mechanosensitive channel protein MscL [Hufsiella ginkgonis]
MGLLKEFKTFAIKGNVIDLAVGVIIGAAFGKIVTSIVDDIIMPPIGYISNGIDFKEMKYVLVKADEANKVSEVAIKYGNFINTAIQFLIVAFCVFLMVKLINSLKRKEEAAPSAPPAPAKEEVLLTEIRDLLKEKNL